MIGFSSKTPDPFDWPERDVRQRAAHCCEYCQLPERYSRLPFVLDHIRARPHGGSDELDNLALCCGHCNRHKGPNLAGIDPVDGQITRLFHSRTDVWADNFQWHGVTLTGLTPVGRTTLGVLAINDQLQRSIRQVLIDEGVLE